MRAVPACSRFYLHYVQGGVGSLAPTLRLRGRSGARHHCAAHSGQSLPRRLVPCFYFPQAVPSSRGRPPAVVLAPPTSWSISLTLRRVLQVLWLWAGSSPTATSCLFYVTSQYSGYASRSSTIPGGGKGQGRHGQAPSVHVALQMEGIHRHASLRRATTQFLKRQ